jgi:hypothetical protein
LTLSRQGRKSEDNRPEHENRDEYGKCQREHVRFHGLRQVLCTAAIQWPVRNRKNGCPDERDHEASDQPEREPENYRRRNPARVQPIRGPASHEMDVGRSSSIRTLEPPSMIVMPAVIEI